MNLERLRAVQAEEREADSLRALPDSFYREVADYIEELREERERAAAAAEDPFDSEAVGRLTDEIEAAEEVAEAIYERRVGKLVKRASLAAAGMPTDEEGLTTEEAELFATLVDRIEEHRMEVLAAFDGDHDGGLAAAEDVERSTDAPPGAPDGVEEETLEAEEASAGGVGGQRETGPPGDPEGAAGEDAPAAPGGSDPPSEPGGSETDSPDVPVEDEDGGTTEDGDPERVTLRITADVGEVFGVDERVYDLAAEDVVTLPAANAKPLLDRDAAEQID